MARKKKHEEHVNTEAWAIPYGDLVTLLFALFTVMYAMSSVNEGKFRVLSDSLVAAFRGAPRTTEPINIGRRQSGKGGSKPLTGITPTELMKLAAHQPPAVSPVGVAPIPGVLLRLEHQVQDAMKSLIDAKLVTVHRKSLWLEVEINTDILFPSGSDSFSPAALPVLDKLADVLKPFPNPIRVEGHTDDRPIHTAAFPSNWELSAGRAASVVHEFTRDGIDPMRLEIVGLGQYHPVESNATAAGRNANRRVAILILEQTQVGDTLTARERDVMLNTGAPSAAAIAPPTGVQTKDPTPMPVSASAPVTVTKVTVTKVTVTPAAIGGAALTKAEVKPQ
ncbi:MAG: flagellar motor protein MotD [Gammaproteobacteria bacterium]|nr:flagellar motor protein MotD [Gammaproteobacteria bacterium]